MKILIELKRQLSILLSVILYNPDIVYVDEQIFYQEQFVVDSLKNSFKNYGYLPFNVGDA